MTANLQPQSGSARKVPLVDIEALRTEIKNLAGLDDGQKRKLEARWLHMVQWWDQRSNENQLKYFVCRRIVLIGGVLTPTLVTLQTSELIGGHKAWFQVAAIVTGLLVAIAAGLEEIFHYGEVWREKRSAAEHLKIEGWRYFQGVGPYQTKDHATAFPDFAANVELMVEHEIKDYLATQPADKGEIQKMIEEEIAKYLKGKNG